MLLCFNEHSLYDFCNLKHYTCMVDLLGHAGHLQEAENMIKAKPCKPDVAVWMALRSAFRIHGNADLGRMHC